MNRRESRVALASPLRCAVSRCAAQMVHAADGVQVMPEVSVTGTLEKELLKETPAAAVHSSWSLKPLWCALPFVLLPCALHAATPTMHGEAAHPPMDAGVARGVLSLDVYANGNTVDVLTGERSAAAAPATLWHRRSIDGGINWSQPARVDEGLPTPHEPQRSNDPQIAADGRNLIAVWGSAGRGFRGAGPMVAAVSSDGGRTWRRGANPADDDRHDGHAFSDLTARNGRFHLTWLDSRGGAQGVRYARSDDRGASWSINTTVKSGSCECCWNTLLPARGRSMYLLFRSKAPRDMGLAMSRDEGASWKTQGAVGAFNWQIEACPHTGGALALTGQGPLERLHAVVWTGKSEIRGLHFLTSVDAGSTWISGVRLGGEYAQRADLAARGDELVAVWDESVGQHAAVFVARSRNSGKEWSNPLKLSSENANAIYPRVVAASSNILVLWTEASATESSKLRMVLLK